MSNTKKFNKRFPLPSEGEEEEQQEDFAAKLSWVGLRDDNITMLLNGEAGYPVALPKYIHVKRKREDRIRIVENKICDGCHMYYLDYVSEDNVRRLTKEVVDLLFQRENVADAAAAIEREEEEKQEEQQQQQPVQQPTIELTKDLTREMTYEELAVILSTSIKRDENPKVITFNGMLLTQTHDDQLNIGFQAESSVGKSYIALDVATYFPESEIVKIASASPTAFYHSGVWDPERKALIVDLRHKSLIFLDMQHFQLLEKLRPMLSHDDHELHYKITDKSQKYGLKTKEVIILGPPSVFFCTAKINPDDQEKTRLILLSPSTDEEKLKESLELLTLKKSNRKEFDRRVMKDPKRVWLMNRVMCVRQGGIRDVIIPDEGKAVFDRFMKEHNHLIPRYQRDYPRIFSFIKAHALLNCFNRKKLSEDTIEADDKDIDAGFELYKGIEQSNEMGLSPYLLKIYDDVFMPILNLGEGVSREEILKQYYKVRRKPLSPEMLRLEIIPQFDAVGLIYQEEGERRKMLVYPSISHPYNKPIVDAIEEAEVKAEAVAAAAADAVCMSDRGVTNEKLYKTEKVEKIEKNEAYPTVSPTCSSNNNNNNNSSFSTTTTVFLKCPHCDFKNIYQESIDHHIKYKHRQGEE